MQTILITGVNGFIGSHVAERLLKEGHTLRGLVRKTSDLSLIEDFDIQLFYGDITEPDTLPPAVRGADIVVHVAGLASDWGPYERFYRINVEGTQNIARAADRAGVKRFVHISTVALHGFGHKQAVDESFPMADTIFPYNESKKEAERWLFEFARKTKMEITAVRPGNVYGPRDHTFIDKYLEALEQGKIAYIDGGRHKTCPVYIENLTDGIILACFKAEAAGQPFIITDGLDITWKEFTNALADAMGLKRPKLSVPYVLVYGIAWAMETVYKILRIQTPPLLTRYRAMNGGRDYYFSIEKAHRVLGYKPLVLFEEAIRRTVDWYKNRKN